jgi:REP element-mobilizing transposase RayT
MSTYTQIIYQIIFSTKEHKKVLIEDNREKLYKYICGILNKKNCHLYRINGVEDHIHICTHLHPSISLANLIKDIKLASSDMIKTENIFPGFNKWQIGYGAFTYSIHEKDKVIEYIKNQVKHHKTETFIDEYKRFLKEYKIKYDEKYLL